MNFIISILIPKVSSVPNGDNLNFDKLCKLEKWSNGAEILVCGGRPSYLSNKTFSIKISLQLVSFEVFRFQPQFG